MWAEFLGQVAQVSPQGLHLDSMEVLVAVALLGGGGALGFFGRRPPSAASTGKGLMERLAEMEVRLTHIERTLGEVKLDLREVGKNARP